MLAADIPVAGPFVRRQFDFGELLKRAQSSARANWSDLPNTTGIYVVFWTADEPPTFSELAGAVRFAKTTGADSLASKWRRICEAAPTDILYIGKAGSLRRRVCTLVRFGVGKSEKHHGGEWIWQVRDIEAARIFIQTCPPRKEVAFESWLLERFRSEHGDLPLANRAGPQGLERWHP
jgi:hypothetical protein